MLEILKYYVASECLYGASEYGLWDYTKVWSILMGPVTDHKGKMFWGQGKATLHKFTFLLGIFILGVVVLEIFLPRPLPIF